MANLSFTWTSGGYQGGCKDDPKKYIDPGWYVKGYALPEKDPIVSTYRNPATGEPYTPSELKKILDTNGPPSTDTDPISDVKEPSSGVSLTVIGGIIIVVIAVIAYLILG